MDNESPQNIRIVRGKNIEGLHYIFVFQYGKAEFRCQNIVVWLDEDVANELKEYVDSLTVEEIAGVVL